MAVTITKQDESQIRNVATGRITNTTTAAALGGFSIGFSPRYVCVVNVSERVQLEFYAGMPQAYSLKTVAAGTRTLASSLGITCSASGFSVGLDTDLLPGGGAAVSAGNIIDFIAFG